MTKHNCLYFTFNIFKLLLIKKLVKMYCKTMMQHMWS